MNHYFLCRAVSFGEKHLTKDEIDSFHLSTLRLTYDEKAWEIMNKYLEYPVHSNFHVYTLENLDAFRSYAEQHLIEDE